METRQALAALSALAQESRLAVFRLLVGAGPAGLAAGEVAEKLGVPPATLSFHLRMLVHANLLRSERQGRSIRYFARFDAMNGLVEYLTDHCCGGDPSACLPAAPGRVARKAKAR
jgi:ArsR family transcriptional regulator, arsenate/arsenite/antimonite-responsive transcriptional repressor